MWGANTSDTEEKPVASAAPDIAQVEAVTVVSEPAATGAFDHGPLKDDVA